MKHTLEKTLGSTQLQELDELLPSGFDLKIPRGKLKRIEKITFQKLGIKPKKRRLSYRILVPAAVGLALCFGGAAAVAEAREYNAAMDFFSENNLSAEGLSRAEVRAVYRDISTQRFSNDKTAEVIRNSVPGTEILQEEPTPEELSTLWNSNLNAANLPKIGTEYKIDYEDRMDADGISRFYKSSVECIRGGISLWKNEFKSFYVEKCADVSGGTLIWGFNPTASSYETIYSFVAFVDDSGEKLWERRLEHGFKYEIIAAVVDNGDGTFAVISNGDLEGLCFSVFDFDGNEIRSQKSEIENRSARSAARLGDGYMVRLTGAGNAEIITLDSYGNITDNIVYEGEDCCYYIEDMAEFEGRVYLSAYAVPKQSDEGGRREIAGILDYIFEKGGMEISPEELTPIVRDNYTAVLLLCDPSGGEPKRFYSAKGSFGGALAVENGELKWDVKSVMGAGFSPYTSSFSIAGSCRVYRYAFNSSGELIQCEKTDETARFTR